MRAVPPCVAVGRAEKSGRILETLLGSFGDLDIEESFREVQNLVGNSWYRSTRLSQDWQLYKAVVIRSLGARFIRKDVR